jgi:hypothetical protein
MTLVGDCSTQKCFQQSMKRPGKTRQPPAFIMWRQEESIQTQRNLSANEEVVCSGDWREIQRVVHKRGNLFPFATTLRYARQLLAIVGKSRGRKLSQISEPPTKLFSMKLRHAPLTYMYMIYLAFHEIILCECPFPTDPRKFSPSNGSRYTVHAYEAHAGDKKHIS